VAIKGKTKRSQGRSVRRPAAGPRVQAAPRREPWWRAPALSVTLAMVALLLTLLGAVHQVREGRERNDVRRFTGQVRLAVAGLPSIIGSGTPSKPGFASAADLNSGKLKPADLTKRAQGWQQQLELIRTSIGNLTIGKLPLTSPPDGVPGNPVGGHVPALTPIRDAYSAAVGFYIQAGHAYELAASAPAKSTLAQQLVSQGETDATRAGAAMDAAATMLARMVARYHLDVTAQMPGESAASYAGRYSKAPQPAGGQSSGLPAG
jgi:hypothetical protein